MIERIAYTILKSWNIVYVVRNWYRIVILFPQLSLFSPLQAILLSLFPPCDYLKSTFHHVPDAVAGWKGG